MIIKFRKLNFLEFKSYFPSVSRKSLLILTLRYGQEFPLRSGVQTIVLNTMQSIVETIV